MSPDEQLPVKDSQDSPASQDSPGQVAETQPGLLTTIVQKIRNEPFLFLIAIVSLLVALAIQATGLASADFRFLVGVIGFLAFTAIAAYYIFQGWKVSNSKARRTQAGKPDTPAARPGITGKVKAREIGGDAELGGVKAGREALNYRGEIQGEVEVGKAQGGRAYGVELGEDSSGQGEGDDGDDGENQPFPE